MRKPNNENERKVVKRFIPIQQDHELPQAQVVAEHRMKVTPGAGSTSGPSYEPVYENGKVIGHNEVMTDLEGVEMDAVLVVLDSGSTFWL